MRKLVTIVANAALTLAVGCGKSAVGPIDGADQGSVSAGLGASTENQAGGFAPQGQGAPFLATSPCTSGSVSITGTTTDSDLDGVPDDAVATWANCMVAGSNGSATYNGTLEVRDPTLSTADYDLNMSLNLTIDYAATAGPSAGATAHQTITGSRSASSPAGTFTQQDATSVNTAFTYMSQTHNIGESHAWAATYAPGSAWSPGQPLVAGGLQLSGSATFSVDSHSSDMSISSSGLLINPACPSYVVAGRVTATWTDGSHTDTVTVNWTGCGVRNGSFSQT